MADPAARNRPHRLAYFAESGSPFVPMAGCRTYLPIIVKDN